jgi:hypothetical protein
MLDHLLHHLSHPDEHQFMALFWKETRYHSWFRRLSVMNGVFQPFDRLSICPSFEYLTLKNILQLPLRCLFSHIPERHWLHRHPKKKTQ